MSVSVPPSASSATAFSLPEDPSLAGENDPIRPWYEAIESVGDYYMIRFGRVRPDASTIDWVDVPHKYFDGIGGFAHLLRRAGIETPPLPETPHEVGPSWRPFLRSLPAVVGPRRRLKWKRMPRAGHYDRRQLPDPVFSWHVFSEEETRIVRHLSQARQITVNTYLLRHLDSVIRRDIARPSEAIPWMLPVNLRGRITRSRDTANHSSYIAVRIAPDDSAQDLHRDIQRRLARGEQWGPWKGYDATRVLPRMMKKALIRTDRAISPWNLGLFTNLGVWDPEKRIKHPAFQGAWLVMATVLRCQMLGAGLMTFQGRLGLTIQAHPELTTSEAVPRRWMNGWLKRIAADYSRMEPQTATP